MRRVVIASILLILIGTWTIPRPRVQGAGGSETHPSLQPQPRGNAPAGPLAVTRGTEGFWRLGQTQDGVWWYLSPRGDREFLNTVTTVQPFQNSRDMQGAGFVSRDWNGGSTDKGDLDAWADRTIARIHATGFKGLGAWCNPVFHKHDVPMTRDLNVWQWMKPDFKRFYSPAWTATAEVAVKTQCEPLKENKNLVGYFIDNELDWGEAGSGPGYYFDSLAPGDPNRQQVLVAIRALWPTLDAFNAAWHVTLNDWTQLDQWKLLPKEPAEAHAKLLSAWIEHLAGDYFRTTTSLIRRYDPNHLILGVRFKGYAPREVVRASKGLTDAQSLNYYVNDAKCDAEMFRMMNAESGQPIIISEYAFHSLDGRSGNRNTVGFAAQVLDQQARADGYRLFTTRLARLPYVIGADWFQWFDEPPGGRDHDGEDVNFGVVDVDDEPYELLAKSIRATEPLLNPLHEASAADDHQDVWRESFASKPVMRVPHLDQPIRLNGELSDWPAACRISNIRHSETIGLERSLIPVPNVYVGWRDEGFYLGFEIFDQDIQGASAKGWWWTRDHVEFWIATKPVAPTQDFYDSSCHQFFFVPVDFPGQDGAWGVVGQWHRAGDALVDHLIPHSDIKSATRVMPDRYVVEIFIPAKAMKGFDPKHQPTLAFNIHARNFQHAIDYFWSAPKEMMTQLRPNTWGTLELDSAEANVVARRN